MKTRYYKTNEIVFKKGSIVHKLIIMEGRIKKFKSANFLAQAGQTWGENYLKAANDIRLDDDIVVETESVLIEISLDNLKNTSILIEDGYRRQSKLKTAEPIPIGNLQYIGELGASPLCSYHYIRSDDKKLIGKEFKVADMERENVLHILKQQLYCTEIAGHPFIPSFYQVIELTQAKLFTM